MEELRYTDGILLGHSYQDVDGFYVFVPLPNGSCYNEISLRFIQEYLRDKNRNWNNYIYDNLNI